MKLIAVIKIKTEPLRTARQKRAKGGSCKGDRRRRLSAQGVGVLILILILATQALSTATQAATSHAYFTTRSVLTEFFSKSEKVTYQTIALAPAIKERLTHRLGYAPAAGRYTIFTASTGDRIDGYAIIDDQLGEHQPITFATKLSPRAVVERVEILAYREPRGDEVRDARFRGQFVGKTSHDPLRLNRDIDAVTGATISSAAMAVAVRRAAILVEEIMLGHTTVATASTATPPHRAP